MLDVGWQELFIIAVITIIVVGPKEIPTVLRTVMSWVRRIKEMAREFQTGIDDIARESELSEIRRELEETANIDLEKEIENTIDPDGELSSDMYDLQKASEEIAQQQEDLAQRQESLATQRESFDTMRTELEAEETAKAVSYSPPDEEAPKEEAPKEEAPKEEAINAIQGAKEDTVDSSDPEPSIAPQRST